LEDDNKYQLVLRPHPNEKDDKYFEDVAMEVGFRNFLIERDVKIEDHFNSCDILITAYSTVGAEFVEYYKPIIVLDYLKEDIVGYVEEGIGIPVYNGKELTEIFKRDTIDIDSHAYDKFMNRFFHSTDGKAAEIILKNILLAHDK
jgi:CDP-glycerol glycerophosphotransferase (TagB/SpsB family)